MRYTITIDNTGKSFPCPENRPLLRAMEAIGLKGIPVGCREGGCGVCKIEVLEGTYETRVMSRTHISEEDEAHHRFLACRVMPTSDLRIRALKKMEKLILKSISD